MLTLPDVIVPILSPFAMLFTNPTWQKAQLLLVGAILTTGQRTVAAALRVMGRSDQDDYARYHEVLNRAVWSPREASPHPALAAAPEHLDHGDGPLGLRHRRNPGTAPRRQDPGPGASTGTRCAPVATSWSKPAGLRWVSLMWLGQVPLGRTLLGPAGAHGAGTIVPLLSAAGTPAQEDHRLGSADGHAVAPLATPSTHRAGGGQRLRRAGFAPLLPVPARSRSPSSPDCAWTRPRMRQRRPASQVKTADRR